MILSERAQDHVARPRNRGELTDADCYGVAGSPGEGPYVQIWLKTDGSRIAKAHYETNGCPSSVASASMLCELATGREMEILKLLDANDLITILGGLPECKQAYAGLAVKAMNNALEEK